MAKHILYNASVVLNGVDLSDHVESVSYVPAMNAQDAAAMGDAEDYSMPGTRVVGDITITLYQDYASAKVYQTLQPLWTNRSTFTATVKADAGANATTNPAFSVSVFIKSFPFVAGQRGQRHMAPLVLAPAGISSIATS